MSASTTSPTTEDLLRETPVDGDSTTLATVPKKKKGNILLERLAQGPLICAEGYVFEMERRGWLQIGPFVPEVVLNDPTAVKQLHREFVRCGSDVVQCFTYFAHKEKMKKVNKAHLVEALNRKAVEIAFEVRKEFSDERPDLLVAGGVSNSTVYEPNNPKNDLEIKEMYREQVRCFADAKVDYCIAETFDYVGEALLALSVIQEFGLPSVVTLAIHIKEVTRDGYTPEDACLLLKQNGADVVGLNCSRGPQTLLPMLKKVRLAVVDGEIAGLPVCYRTNEEFPTMGAFGSQKEKFLALDCHTCTRADLAQFAKEAVSAGINYIGTCCGGAPHHVRAMTEAIGRKCIASEYTEDIAKDWVYGDAKHTKKHNRDEAEWR